jgi:hypothetical protein
MEVLFSGQNGKNLIETLMKSNDLSQVILESSGKMLMMHVVDNQVKVDELIPTEVIRPLAMRCDMSYQIVDYNLDALRMCQSDMIMIDTVKVLCNPKHLKLDIMYSRLNAGSGKQIIKNQITYLQGQIVS